MALQAILQAIADDAEAQAAAIVAQAETDAGLRLQSARRDAEERRQGILLKAAAEAENERSRLLHRARLDVSRVLVAAQEQAFQAIMAHTAELLAHARSRPDYPNLFTALMQQALDATSGPVSVGVHDVDRALATSVLAANPRPAPASTSDRIVRLEAGLDTWGGVAVRSEDGRVVTTNTLESRLERSLPDLRPLLSPILEAAMQASRQAS